MWRWMLQPILQHRIDQIWPAERHELGKRAGQEGDSREDISVEIGGQMDLVAHRQLLLSEVHGPGSCNHLLGPLHQVGVKLQVAQGQIPQHWVQDLHVGVTSQLGSSTKLVAVLWERALADVGCEAGDSGGVQCGCVVQESGRDPEANLWHHILWLL